MNFRLFASLCFAGAVFAAAPVAAASALSAGASALTAAAGPSVEQVQYYYAPRRVYVPHRRYYHGGYGYRRGYRGDGIAVGLAAGAIGALAIGGLAASGAFDPAPAAIAPPRRQWCADRYRSYNPADGTFIDSRGRTRFCG